MARVTNGSNGRAVELYRAWLDGHGRFLRDHAINRAQLARALLVEGDRTQAISEGQQLLPNLGKRITSTRVLSELRPIRAAAEKAAAEEFCERFDAAARALAGAK